MQSQNWHAVAWLWQDTCHLPTWSRDSAPLPSKSHRHLPKGCTPRRQSWCLLLSGSGLWNFKPPTLDFIGSYWRPAAQATFPPKMGNLLFPSKFPVLVLDEKMYCFPLWPLCLQSLQLAHSFFKETLKFFSGFSASQAPGLKGHCLVKSGVWQPAAGPLSLTQVASDTPMCSPRHWKKCAGPEGEASWPLEHSSL